MSTLTPGHWRSLEAIEDGAAVLETLRRYELALGNPVYLRPTAKGLTVLSLDTAPPAMVGVGAKDGCSILALPPSEAQVADSVAAYRAKVAAMKRHSAEERYVVGCIRAAFENALQLGEGLIFLHQEWRFTTREKLDLLAVDSSCGQLVVIEVKRSRAAALDGATVEQGCAYAALLTARWPEYVEYFRRLAAAWTRVYNPSGPIPAISDEVSVRCEVWWPDGRHRASLLPAAAAGGVQRGRPAARSEDVAWRGELAERQSRWREAKGYPVGLHRGAPMKTRLAMPAAERERWNFITPAIGELVAREYEANSKRGGSARKLYGYPRLFDNMLSSQPLAFNLFGELALDLGAATAACRGLWPGRVDAVTRIELEWSPGRQSPRYLNNGTAADIAIFHTTPNGGTGAVFVETKYYEDMSAEAHGMKPRYLEVATACGAFLADALPVLQSGWLQQLWLDHLLLIATRDTDSLDTGLFAVWYPVINPKCSAATSAYAGTLTPHGSTTFEARTLEEVVSVLDREVGTSWVTSFKERYLTST